MLLGSELLKGAIDMHCHPLVHQPAGLPDYIEVARGMQEAGMAGVVFKPHFVETTSASVLVNQVVPGFQTFGGLIMEGGAGGLNPYVVKYQLEIGAKEIWMPLWTQSYWDNILSDPKGYQTRSNMKRAIASHGPLWRYLDRSGEIRKEIKSDLEKILALIADANVIFNTGHASAEEALVLVEEAKTAGVKKIMVDHPLSITVKATIEQQQEMVKKGAYMEQTWAKMQPTGGATDPKKYVEAIKSVGAEHTVMSSDYGSGSHPLPDECLRQFIVLMQHFGITNGEIELMVKTNPRYLLGL